MPGVIEQLRERGLLNDVTDPKLEEYLNEHKVPVYVGFDPSADSLHVGNMVGILVLRHFQLCGHQPIALVGGATGMIGDPGGRSAERNLLTKEQLEKNLEGIKKDLSRFLDFTGENSAVLVNNADWMAPYHFIDFLRDIGKHFRIGDMLGKESVKARLESENGISYTEFSYMLLQAYDYKHLYEELGVKVQSGGSDQWGNITAGIDLIRRTTGGQAYGMTTPLLVDSQGRKMGKSVDGALWLNPEKFSPYQFYQFWVRQQDADLERFLKMLTFLPLDEISSILEEHNKAPENRSGQKRLARELTALVHGNEEADKASGASDALFGGGLSKKSDSEIKEIFSDVPSVSLDLSKLEEGYPVLDLLVDTKLCPSKKEARRVVGQGGFYLNNSNDSVSKDKKTLGKEDLASETMMILRTGKKKYCLVQFS